MFCGLRRVVRRRGLQFFRTGSSARILALGLLLVALGGCSADLRRPHHPDHHHYSGDRFHNIEALGDQTRNGAERLGLGLRMQLGLFPRAKELPPDHVLGEAAVHEGLNRSARAEFAVTWIGHSTMLVRIGDQWVLTDPAMLDNVGFGPFRLKRLVPPQPTIDQLPRIDVIVISHADHDHFDIPTLRRLAVRNPDATVFVPLRNGPVVRAAGFRDVREMDWFDRDRSRDLEIVAVPAIHGLRRPPYRLNSALWAGWVLKSRGSSLYFSGDTAFGEIFHDIRERVGPVDVAVVPIGAYSPRSVQGSFHTDPEEAAEAARILGARIAIGMHWGTFPLTPEPPVEQKARFLAASGRGLSTHALRVGETLVLR